MYALFRTKQLIEILYEMGKQIEEYRVKFMNEIFEVVRTTLLFTDEF